MTQLLLPLHAAPTFGEFMATLAAFDWSYNYSDDPSAYARGFRQAAEISLMREEFDRAGFGEHAAMLVALRVK